MRKWTKLKEQAERMSIYDCNPLEVTKLLKDLVEWLDEYFYGEQNKRLIEYLKIVSEAHHDAYDSLSETNTGETNE